MELTVGDYNNDGRLNLFVTSGHTDERLESRFPSDTNAEPNYLHRNESGTRFVDVSDRTGLRDLEDRMDRGTAFPDFDSDRDMDVLEVNKDDRPVFLLNEGGNRRNWLATLTRDRTGNRDGIATNVVVTAGGHRRVFEFRVSDRYPSSNDMRVHVGLGDLEVADISIRWPSGTEDLHEAVPGGKPYLAFEGEALGVEPRPLAWN